MPDITEVQRTLTRIEARQDGFSRTLSELRTAVAEANEVERQHALALRECLSSIAHAFDRLATVYEPPESID